MLINNFDSLESSENPSGAPWFQVVRPEDVSAIPDVILDQISTAITLAGGATAYNMKATVGTVDWVENTEDVGGRDIHTARMTFVIPKDRADVLNYARELNNKGVIAIVRDASDQRRLMGSIEEPAVFRRVTRTTGKLGGAERNQHVYEIVYSGRNPVPFYQVTTHLPAPANTCPPSPSLSVAVSDSTPNFGDSITITATASNITPTTYDFWVPIVGGHERVSQASNTYAYTVAAAGAPYIYVGCDDGTDSGYTITPVQITVTALPLDGLPCMPATAWSHKQLHADWVSATLEIRKVHDGSVDDYLPAELDDGTLVTDANSQGAFVQTGYDQSGHNRDWTQSTSSDQPQIVDNSGNLLTDDNGAAVLKKVDAQKSLECRARLSADSCTAFFVCKPNGGELSGRYYSMLASSANPSLGRADDQETSLVSPSLGCGTPSYYINGSVLSSYYRSQMGTQTLNEYVVVSVVGIDWSDSSNWETALLQAFEYMGIDSDLAAVIVFNDNVSAYREQIEDNLMDLFSITP